MADFDRRNRRGRERGQRRHGRPFDGTAHRPVDDHAPRRSRRSARRRGVAGARARGRILRPPPDPPTRRLDAQLVEYAMRATRIDGRVLVLGVCLHERSTHESVRPHEAGAWTAREREIVHRIALGDITAEICAELHVAPDTVRAHVRNAMAKTGARTRAQLIAIALTDELLDALRWSPRRRLRLGGDDDVGSRVAERPEASVIFSGGVSVAGSVNASTGSLAVRGGCLRPSSTRRNVMSERRRRSVRGQVLLPRRWAGETASGAIGWRDVVGSSVSKQRPPGRRNVRVQSPGTP